MNLRFYLTLRNPPGRWLLLVLQRLSTGRVATTAAISMPRVLQPTTLDSYKPRPQLSIHQWSFSSSRRLVDNFQ